MVICLFQKVIGKLTRRKRGYRAKGEVMKLAVILLILIILVQLVKLVLIWMS